MLAKRRQILESLPKYHKDCFAFNHLRAVLSYDKLYLFATRNHITMLKMAKFIDIFKTCNDPRILPQICYLFALHYKVLYMIKSVLKINPKIEFNMNSRMKADILECISPKYIILRNSKDENILSLDESKYMEKYTLDILRSLDICIKDPEKTLSILFLTTYRYRFGRIIYHDKTSRRRLCDFSDIYKNIEKILRDESPDKEILCKCKKILTSICFSDPFQKKEWFNCIGVYFDNNKIHSVKSFYDWLEPMYQQYKEQIKTRDFSVVCSNITLKGYDIWHIVTLKKYLFENMMCCDLCNLDVDKYYAIDAIKNLKRTTIKFDTNASIFELIDTYNNFNGPILTISKPKNLLKKFIARRYDIIKFSSGSKNNKQAEFELI